MIQFVRGNIEQATELMLFNSTEILLKLELYLKNIFQIRSNTLFKYKYKYKYANLVFFKYKYKYKYKYLRIWIQIQIRIRIWTQPCYLVDPFTSPWSSNGQDHIWPWKFKYQAAAAAAAYEPVQKHKVTPGIPGWLNDYLLWLLVIEKNDVKCSKGLIS